MRGDFLANFLAAYIFGAIVRKNPPGRARPLVLLCHGQGTFQTPSLLTYVHLPEFDFITPDCHLLGKKLRASSKGKSRKRTMAKSNTTRMFKKCERVE